MTYTLNLAELPAVRTVEFLLWIHTNKIGNYENLYRFIAEDESWYLRETVPFECTEKEAMWVILKWS